jgi:hypothetical protein
VKNEVATCCGDLLSRDGRRAQLQRAGRRSAGALRARLAARQFRQRRQPLGGDRSLGWDADGGLPGRLYGVERTDRRAGEILLPGGQRVAVSKGDVISALSSHEIWRILIP